MNCNIAILIITLLICSYILITNCSKINLIGESFENSEDIINDLKSEISAPIVKTNPSTILFDAPGTDVDGNEVPAEIITQYEEIDTKDMYKNILMSDDIKIDPEPVSEPKYEILDTIIKEDNNRFRTIQFENQERELM